MWADPQDLEIDVYRNTQTHVGFQIIDATSDAPVDLTGLTVVCRTAETVGGDQIEEIAATDFIPLEGSFGIVFNGNEYAGLPGTSEKIRIAFQILATNEFERYTIALGPINLYPGIN